MNRESFREDMKRKITDMSNDKIGLMIFVMQRIIEGADITKISSNIESVRQVCAKNENGNRYQLEKARK